MRRLLLLSSLLLLACGGRTQSGWKPSNLDGAGPRLDRGPVYADGTFNLDGPLWRKDMPQPIKVDKAKPDASCLPIPASQVQGLYKGGWKGTWTCAGQPANSASGDLTLQLQPAGGGTSFVVTGALSGTVGSASTPLSISSSVNGTMSCVTLNASLPNLTIGYGGFIKGTGSIAAQFMPTSSGMGGFPNGSWTVTQTNGSCKGTGLWYANRQ